MSEIILYEEMFNRPVTAEAVQGLERYYKVFMEGDIIKKKEYYVRGRLESLMYYKQHGETESEAVAAVLSGYIVRFFEIREREAWGAFIIERSEAYDGTGNNDHYQVTELYDAEGRLIYEKTYSVFKGVSETEVRKYCFDTTSNGNLECFYDKAGMLKALSGKEPPFVPENNHTVKADEFPLFFPDFIAKHPYYATADFLPDTDTL
jgi:hypothetical protein